jgi:hypothetical protein
MKVGDLNDDIGREQRCEALGDVIAETIGTPAPGATGPLPEEVARVAARRPRRQLRAVWKLAPAMALVGGAAVLVLMLRPQPLHYELSGTYAARDDAFETPGNGTATARFSDGTSIAVGAAQRGARPGPHARRCDHPPRSRAGVVRGRAPPRRQLERRGRPVRDRGDGH